MASKKYIGKTCVYCASANSTTGDHVVARSLFPEEQRANLPKVPACHACNETKAQLEHYLAALLPFGGRQPGSAAYLQATVPRMLAKNVALHRELKDQQEKIWTNEQHGLVLSTALPFEGEKLNDYWAVVARALSWHHWGELILPGTFVAAQCVTPLGQQLYAPLFELPGVRKVEVALGEGMFTYTGVQDGVRPQVTAWRFEALNGLKVTDGETECSQWIVTTGVQVKGKAE